MDAGVVHVVNMQPFHTWDSPSAGRRTAPVTAEQNNPEVLDNEYDDTQDDLCAADMSYDTPGVADSLLLDCDSVHHSTVMVSDNDLDPTGWYDLRPRHHPRIT